MTTEASRDQLPDPQLLIAETDWAGIEHADGPADDTPLKLVKLLDGESLNVDDALRHLTNRIWSENSVYPAAVPVALYVAAILADPRAAVVTSRFLVNHWVEHVEARPVRAVLLDWLGCLASDIDDETVRIMKRHGFTPDEYPDVEELRAWRPALVQAVSAFLDDPDRETRHAAAVAAVLLIDSPEAVERHGLIPCLREVLSASADQYHRNRAIDALNAHAERTGSAPIPKERWRSWSPQPQSGSDSWRAVWGERPF